MGRVQRIEVKQILGGRLKMFNRGLHLSIQIGSQKQGFYFEVWPFLWGNSPLKGSEYWDRNIGPFRFIWRKAE